MPFQGKNIKLCSIVILEQITGNVNIKKLKRTTFVQPHPSAIRQPPSPSKGKAFSKVSILRKVTF